MFLGDLGEWRLRFKRILIAYSDKYVRRLYTDLRAHCNRAPSLTVDFTIHHCLIGVLLCYFDYPASSVVDNMTYFSLIASRLYYSLFPVPSLCNSVLVQLYTMWAGCKSLATFETRSTHKPLSSDNGRLLGTLRRSNLVLSLPVTIRLSSHRVV